MPAEAKRHPEFRLVMSCPGPGAPSLEREKADRANRRLQRLLGQARLHLDVSREALRVTRHALTVMWEGVRARPPRRGWAFFKILH